MSHQGNSSKKRKEPSQQPHREGRNNQNDSFQPHRLVRQRSNNSLRPQSSNRNVSAFSGKEDSNPSANIIFGVNNDTNADNGNDEIIRHNPSIELLASGLNFENRGSSMTAPARLSSSSTLLNENSFEIENYDHLSEELRLNPLIDIGEPNADFPFTHSFEDHNDSSIYPQNAYRRGVDVSEATVSAIFPNCYKKYIYCQLIWLWVLRFSER